MKVQQKIAVTVLDHESSHGQFGASFRRSRPGPESQLVAAFLKDRPFSVPRDCHATVFCEPKLDSGFPDLVIVFWKPSIAQNWVPARAMLTSYDIQLVHFLHQSGPLDTASIQHRLGCAVKTNLERLEEADLVYKRGAIWKPRSMATAFAVKKIVAIEAKISEWRRAVHQAFQNTWFASDSYVLLPKVNECPIMRSSAGARGVKVFALGSTLSLDFKTLTDKPRSYASWMFNEWSWRAATV